MGIFTVTKFHIRQHALLLLAALVGISSAHAQNINVTGANSTNNRVYTVTFGGKHGPGTTVLNSDWSSFGSIRSVAFLVNPSTTAVDLLVADNTGSKISVYPGDFTKGPPPAPSTSTMIWSPAVSPGPTQPDGMSVDLAGDLFVVNTAAGQPQLWEFPAAGTNNCTLLPHYAALCMPVLIDGSFSAGQVLVETTIAPSLPTGGAANTGDVLLLTSNPATVVDYSASNNFARSTLITLPGGITPGGVAFWPFGDGGSNPSSLLITNQTMDTILRYGCCTSPAAMTPFATNLGGSGRLLYKINTGYQVGVPYAYATEAGSVAVILQFGEGASPTGPGTLLNTISQNINHPEGISITNNGAAAANTCGTKGGGCNPTGLLGHLIPSQTTPALAEAVCFVNPDPRVTLQNGVWSCDGTPLVLNKPCPGIDPTGTNIFIPGWYCGMALDNVTGTPQGFTVIRTIVDDSKFNTLLPESEDSVAVEPACRPGNGNNPTKATGLWAGTNEGKFLASGNTNQMFDNLAGCGSVKQTNSGGSLSAIGLVINCAAVTPENGGAPSPAGCFGTLGDNAYDDLEAQIETVLPANILNVGGQLAALTPAGPTGCVYLSQSFFDFAQLETTNLTQQTQDYTIAADLLAQGGPTTCDSVVTNNLSDFVQNGSTPPFNPSGQVRSRLAPIYFNTNSRILGNQPNASDPPWPPSTAPAAPPGTYSILPMAPDLQNPCVGAGLYPPPGGCPYLNPQAGVVAGYSETVNYTLYGSTGGYGLNLPVTACTLTSADGTFSGQAANPAGSPPAFPFGGQTSRTVPSGAAPPSGSAPIAYTYTLSCPYPDTANAAYSTVKATVNVYAPPTITAPSGIISGNPVTVSWVLSGSTGCALTSSDHQYTNFPVSNSPTSVTYTPIVTPPVTITYTLACNAPSMTSTSAQTLVTGPLTLSLSPNPVFEPSQGAAQVSWTLGGNTTCALSVANGTGSLTPMPTSPLAGDGASSYTPGASDTGVTFAINCTSPSTQTQQVLTVSPDP
jgi:hypothetical protein